MKMHTSVPEVDRQNGVAAMREELARGDALLLRVTPILEHLLATPDHSLFSDELVARIRGMCHDLAWQILRAQAEATGEAGREAFADRHGEALAQHFFSSPLILSHCHALALEWQLATRMEVQYGIDPVLTPALQRLIASSDSSQSSAAMAALAAQARFSQSQRRMELPLAELPGDLFHELLMGWRAFNGERRSDAMIRAEAKLRNAYDESAGRLALLARLVAGMGETVGDALDIQQGGVALFLSALAAKSGQSRFMAVLSTNERQTTRLALGLRAAGLDAQAVSAQVLRLHPQATPLAALRELTPSEALAMLADAGSLGVG
ncbi:hypothetical protein K3172_09930 [Qipengyuania sp. 6B39]|uniref:hypothetical protein n=1 Tax=Qipengyuania proteolytica TaxID=2867239 RepID=UPI001C89D423|nr:hypothetical protein [Qipengyuania proteolytica]MBX7496169.1 hypothetical protein [Qipengyuania proteolytica]